MGFFFGFGNCSLVGNLKLWRQPTSALSCSPIYEFLSNSPSKLLLAQIYCHRTKFKWLLQAFLFCFQLGFHTDVWNSREQKAELSLSSTVYDLWWSFVPKQQTLLTKLRSERYKPSIPDDFTCSVINLVVHLVTGLKTRSRKCTPHCMSHLKNNTVFFCFYY